MGSVLIAMSKVEDAKKFAQLIKRQGMSLDVSICEKGADVLRIANDRDYGAVICLAHLKDMGYEELAEMLPEFFGLIVLTKDESLVQTDRMVKLILPFKARDLVDAVESMTQDFYQKLKAKKRAPKKRDTLEQNLVDQAKQILMEDNGMSEEEAFRYMQKNSMDLGRKMVETAQMVISLYG